MENQLKNNNTHQSSIVLSKISLNKKEIEIAKIIYHVNQLTNYPLSAIQIEDWSKSINDLYPNLDIMVLKKIIRGMKLNVIEWDYRRGIQNITQALRDEGVYDEETYQLRQSYLQTENRYESSRKPKVVY